MAASPDLESILGGVPTGALLGGEWVEREARLDVFNPSTEEKLASIADCSVADGIAALDSCEKVGPSWAASTPMERSEILRRAWELMLDQTEQLAAVITAEMGKPLAESRGEVKYAADYVRWYAGEAVRLEGDYRVSPTGDSRIITMRQPVGPCLLITPWNFPLAMITRKVAPAIAAGCTAIVKPARETPLACQMMGKIFMDAGLPAGVLNIVPSTHSGDLSSALLADPRLRKISFTGSTGVGRTLLKQASQNIVRSSMELGGNAPFIVLDDADLDQAVEGAMVAKFRNGGESCVAANRILVHRPIAEEFTARLLERIRRAVAADGFSPDATVGPMINATQREGVAGLVDDALAVGAQLQAGGEARSGRGFFFEPTLITDVPREARISREEIFGPIAAVGAFDTVAEAIERANDSEFGLTAFVFTRDINRAFTVAEGLESGMVGINRGLVSNAAAPFGGVKSSGIGREGGFEGINEYLNVKYLAVDATGFGV